MFNTVNFVKEDSIGIITINRPKALNALNEEVITELEDIINLVENDSEMRALILTGEGRSFVAGADIGAQAVLDIEGGRNWGIRGSKLFRRIEKLGIPTIAAVNGFALGGGCELAMCFDMIIASTKAKFGQPEVTLGIIPGFSGTQRLPKWVGVAKAKELIYTGTIISAEEAEKIGLANRLVEPEELMNEAMNLARTIIKNAPIAVKYSKLSIDRGVESNIDLGITIENELFAMCFATEDQKEGMHAFLEKRPVTFKNK